VVVYAGAIMVLFLFVLMLLNVKREERPAVEGRTLKTVAIGLGTVLALQVGTVVARAGAGVSSAPAVGFDASTRRVAQVLFSPHYLYVFEATSVLILAALVGAVVLARKDP
jgi:NADH-quinone oxidoreductase subunit J